MTRTGKRTGRRGLLLAVAGIAMAAAALGDAPEKHVFAERYEGRIRVACVGDGVTYGLGLADREAQSYPRFFQKLLGERFETRNFGVPGATVSKDGDTP